MSPTDWATGADKLFLSDNRLLVSDTEDVPRVGRLVGRMGISNPSTESEPSESRQRRSLV
jgi:hypothetical protein